MGNTSLHDCCKRFCYLLTFQVHTNAVGLHDSGISIDIDNQSRKIVALAVNQPVGVVLRIVCHPNGQSHLKGRLEA